MTNEYKNDAFFIKGKNGKKIFLYSWNEVSNPKAVVQIFHGMAEHAGRYEEFAYFLNKQGFIVYADDHRGHGRTAGSVDKLGCIGKDGFNKIVEDEYVINEYIKEKHKGLPIIIFAHSFGSFVAQEYLIKYVDSFLSPSQGLIGIILCGSAARTGIDVKAGIILSYIQKSILGEDRKSKLMDFLTFCRYNKKINNKNCVFDWISTDTQEIEKYKEDQFCGTVFTSGFYFYFLKGLSKLYKKERLSNIPKEFPLFIISGSEDPVGNYEKNVKKLFHIYKDMDIKNVTLKFYEGKRHELLHEVNRYEVFSDITKWIDEICSIS